MRWRSSGLPVLLLLLLTLSATVSGFRICSYNVQKFNLQKASNYRVMHTLTRVIAGCDICLLQNVIDSEGEVIRSLLSSLNRETDRYDDNYLYKSVSSKGLGKSADDMQQYVFLYRTQTVNVVAEYQYKSKQSFLRAPFIVQFQGKRTAIKKFILVPLHTDPTHAIQEIDQLYDVFKEVSKKWNNTNVMFLGDFHAACAYVTRANRKNIRLFTNTSFSWLIKDKVDTTVSDDTNCAYDRIVVYGEPFLKAISPSSAKVYNIAKEFKLTRSKVLEVSDHFPVEVKLKSSALLLQATPLLILLVQSFLSAL
ncbi:deoxyribonuclease gamma-like isoform X1 [Seriola dumerili]|uniref:Deoxyribonuclease n=1 Tax=Seriola dumerili TaxID=41447 RepID=A0A3B4VN83_SERDU|nr:deoxyribonuclease gamma-like isoform X1 [Seriola dumerili]XP_022622550.1 deoxyribonuclease gamma-like isoform X1 [Seriola dumerili]